MSHIINAICELQKDVKYLHVRLDDIFKKMKTEGLSGAGQKAEISKEIIVRNRSLHTITSISELDLIITNYKNYMYASNRDSLILFIEVKSDFLEKTTEYFRSCQFSTKFEMTKRLICENSASDIFIYDVEIRNKVKI